MPKTMKPKKAGHRNKVCTLFLTYPRCDSTKERILEHLQSIDTVREYVICDELHADGTPHRHAYVKFDSGLRPSEFTPTLDVDGHHGNYQAVRSFRAVVKYVSKGGVYITNLSDAMLETPQAKRAKLAVRVRDESIKDLVTEGVIHMRDIKNAQTAKALLSTAYTHDTVRGLWLYGPPHTGKSHAARLNYGGPVYIKDLHKWWDNYNGEPVVLFDDFEKDRAIAFGHDLKRWADKWACTGEVKGGTVQLQHKVFIVTCNYSIEDCYSYDPVLCSAIKRRFRVVFMDTPYISDGDAV